MYNPLLSLATSISSSLIVLDNTNNSISCLCPMGTERVSAYKSNQFPLVAPSNHSFSCCPLTTSSNLHFYGHDGKLCSLSSCYGLISSTVTVSIVYLFHKILHLSYKGHLTICDWYHSVYVIYLSLMQGCVCLNVFPLSLRLFFSHFYLSSHDFKHVTMFVNFSNHFESLQLVLLIVFNFCSVSSCLFILGYEIEI